MLRLRLRGMRLAVALCGMQLATGLLGAALFGQLLGSGSASAALYGAAVAIVPGFYMALHILPQRIPGNVQYRAWLLGLGQTGKWILTGALFIFGALVFGRHFGPLLATYAACQVCYWLALMTTR